MFNPIQNRPTFHVHTPPSEDEPKSVRTMQGVAGVVAGLATLGLLVGVMGYGATEHDPQSKDLQKRFAYLAIACFATLIATGVSSCALALIKCQGERSEGPTERTALLMTDRDIVEV